MKLRSRGADTESLSGNAELEETADLESSETRDAANTEKPARGMPAGIMFYAKVAGFGILAAAVGGLSAYVFSQFQDTGTAELQLALDEQSRDIGAMRDKIAEIETEVAAIGGRLTDAGELRTDIDSMREIDAAQTATAQQHGRALESRAAEIADLKVAVADLSRELSALEESSRRRLAELEAKPPTVISVDTPEGQEQELVSRLTEIESSLSALRSRVAVLESGTAVMAETKGITERVALLEARVESLTGPETLTATIEENSRRISGLESLSGGTPALSGSGLGIVAVRAAVEIGTPYSRIISDAGLGDDDLPAVVLEHAGSGVVTASYLRESFDGFAREGLKESSRPDGTTGEGGGLSEFLRSLFHVRPLSPREGESAGAILSRAEAALEEGSLERSLQILESLPETSRSAMSKWIEAAEARVAVLSALDGLAGAPNGE